MAIVDADGPGLVRKEELSEPAIVDDPLADFASVGRSPYGSLSPQAFPRYSRGSKHFWLAIKGDWVLSNAPVSKVAERGWRFSRKPIL